MDPELKAFTKIGQLNKIKENFREMQSRLTNLEKANHKLTERVLHLEKRLEDTSPEKVPGD